MKHDRQPLSVNATDANQRFSRLLAESEQGRDVVITKRGRPVARLVSIGSDASTAAPLGVPAGSDVPDYDKRMALIETCRRMNATGLNQGTSGNASIRVDDGLLITPSGLDYDKTSPVDIVKIDWEGKVLRGHRPPSSEWHFHCRVMAAKPKAGALLHTHSIHATTLACLSRGIPPFHYMVAVAGGRDIRCAPYATFGTEKLADAVLAALEGRLACLMENHGMIVLGRDIEDAFKRAIEIETLANQYLKALAVGMPKLLTVGEMDVVLEKFKNYSAWADPKK
ncbi:MAG: type II toxin-antitoxin system prevent-host-death family antitoxin [Rhodospirillales bacterium]|nr:type II toxin-antitoxin system prevent-host-death family antitoxin [Rhodospirillales bacterium]MBO6785602.1 type II toxin-antitoxin system prevent-host-death family antitoxin [Rhodospirillales bacterium]